MVFRVEPWHQFFHWLSPNVPFGLTWSTLVPSRSSCFLLQRLNQWGSFFRICSKKISLLRFPKEWGSHKSFDGCISSGMHFSYHQTSWSPLVSRHSMSSYPVLKIQNFGNQCLIIWLAIHLLVKRLCLNQSFHCPQASQELFSLAWYLSHQNSLGSTLWDRIVNLIQLNRFLLTSLKQCSFFSIF